MNLPADEPKDGDFVAYLEELERQQLAHLPSAAQAAPEGAAKGAAPTTRRAPKQWPPALVGTLVLGAIGLFFLMLGLAGDGGWIALAIGAFLLWRAAKALSSDVRKPASDVRALLATKFPSGGKRG
jgi:hypothetical protein